MEGLPSFAKGDNAEDWLVQFSAWINNQPNLDAVLRGLFARTDLPVTHTDTVTLSLAPIVPSVANGTVAAVFTANMGPAGLATAIAGWVQLKKSDGTAIYFPYWVMS